MYLRKLFLHTVGKMTLNKNITGVYQKKIKSSWKECVTWACFMFWAMKIIFRKLQVSKSLVMVCLQITENNFPSRIFAEFTQTRKRYPIFLHKLNIPTRTLLVISSQTFSFELNSFTDHFLQNISYLSLRLNYGNTADMLLFR